MSDILTQLTDAAKRTPGLLAGAPVDVANLVAGAVSGRGLSGLSDNPVGGSKQINSLFGLTSESGGVVQDSAEAILGLLTPGGAAKAVVGGMIVPARLLGNSSMKQMMEFVRAESLKSKTAKELYDQTGVFRGQLDPKKLKGIIDDSASKFKAHPDFSVGSVSTTVSPQANIPLFDVLDHPELRAMADKDNDLKLLHNVKIQFESNPRYHGSYNPNTDVITMAPASSPDDWMSTLLHEVQHAIQFKTSMINGGDPRLFLKDSSRLSDALMWIKHEKDDIAKKLSNVVTGSAEETALYARNKQATLDQQALQNVNNKAYRAYLELQGETDARTTQRMFRDPREIKAYDPDLPDPDKVIKASELRDPSKIDKTKLFDADPTIKALIDKYVP